MTDHDTHTARSDDAGDRSAQAIEALLAAWVLATESGETPLLPHFLAQLATKDEREQFLDLVDQLAFADHNLPLRLRQYLVISGRYELLAAIGSGGMGQVWRALDRKLGHEVAVKVLSLAATAALDLDHLVEREGRLLAKLSHPGIVRILDTGRDGEHRFLVMELIGGQGLADLIEQARERRHQRHEVLGGDGVLQLVGPAPAGRAAVLDGSETWMIAVTKIVVELLRTLEAAHGAGVVHRDLKPANVRLTGGAFPVLLDFGISLNAGTMPGTMTAAMFGTAQYSAPEQWTPGAAVGVHTDVYQAGLVLYELLTLHRCFGSTSPIETMQAVRAAKYPRPRQVVRSLDAGLEACVLRAMDVDPARRYRSAAEFRQDLERFLAGEVPEAAKGLAMVSRRVRSVVRRHRLGLLLAAAVAIGAFGVWVLRSTPGLSVAPIEGTSWAWSADAPVAGSLVVAASVVDANGELRIAPVRAAVGKPPKRGGIAPLEYGTGTSRVDLAPVGDVPRTKDGQIKFRPVHAAAGDAIGKREIAAWVAAMDQARGMIEQRNGEWLSAAEWDGLFKPARGSAGIQVTAEQLFGDSAWHSGALRGFVVSQQLP